MSSKPDPMTTDDHDEQAAEEADEKMLLRHDEHDHGEASRDERSPFDNEHDPVKMAVMWGLSAQCFLHSISFFWAASLFDRAIASLVALLLIVFVVVLIEGTAVKLNWKKLPEFIAFAIAMSLLCVFVVIAKS